MAYKKVKTEGKGRYCTREEAKVGSRKRRRRDDKKKAKEDEPKG